MQITSATIKAWVGQATTGGGIAALVATGSAALAGQMTWPQAIPLLAAGFIGIIWPENTPKRHPKHPVKKRPGAKRSRQQSNEHKDIPVRKAA